MVGNTRVKIVAAVAVGFVISAGVMMLTRISPEKSAAAQPSTPMGDFAGSQVGPAPGDSEQRVPVSESQVNKRVQDIQNDPTCKGADQLPPEKAAFIKQECATRIQHVRDTLHTGAPPKDPTAKIPVVPQQPHVWTADELGIHSEVIPVKEWSAPYDFIRVWYGQNNIVYAGVRFETPNNGVLVLATRDLPPKKLAEFGPPNTGGKLDIVAEAVGKLTIKAANGQTYLFDVATQTLTKQ